MLTKVPVMPTAFGTVMDRKKVARWIARGCGDQVGAHVLDDVDAVVSSSVLWTGKAIFRVLAGNDLDRPGVGADENHLLRREPLRRRRLMPGSPPL